MSEPVDLDGIEARANAATPGPWHGEHDEFGCVHAGDYGWVAGGHHPDRYPHYDEDSSQGKADAEFIAHARADVPALVAEVRALRAKVAGIHLSVYSHDDAVRPALGTSERCLVDELMRQLPIPPGPTPWRRGPKEMEWPMTRRTEPPPYHFRVTEDGQVEPTR